MIPEKFLIFLFVMSMLLTKDIKAADFPIYSLLLLLTARKSENFRVPCKINPPFIRVPE